MTALRPAFQSAMLERARFDAAIIDLDGTLVDTLGDFEQALNRTLRELGLMQVKPEFIARTIGKGSEHLLRQALAEVGADARCDAAAWAAYQRHYAAVNGRYSAPFPGAAEGLRQLRVAGLRLACVTNKPGAFAAALLRQAGLAPFFDHCFGGDAFERKKPDPLPIRMACAALGSTPARTLVVGDSQNDVQAARAAGCPVWLVAHGYNHGQPAATAGADGVAERLDTLRFV